MEKIKCFFENKVVKIVEGSLVAICSVGLIIGGVNAETIAKVPALAGGVVLAVESLITLIQGFTTKKE